MNRMLTDDEFHYLEKVRDILTSDPIHGLPKEPTQLSTHVYIGSQSHAESLRLLRKYGITHVLNCAGYKGPRPIANASPYQGLDIEYLEFQAEDDDRYDITVHFDEAFKFMDEVKRKKGAVLVHCALGINRSGAICVAYLMVDKKITLLEAVKFIKRRRAIVLCNKGFQRQLIKFGKSRGLLNKPTAGDMSLSIGANKGQGSALAEKLPNGTLSAVRCKNKAHLWSQLETKSDSFGGYEYDYASGYRFKQSKDKYDATKDVYRPHYSVDSPLTRRRQLKRYPLQTSLSLQAPHTSSLPASPVRSFKDDSSDEEGEGRKSRIQKRRKSSITHRYRACYSTEPAVTVVPGTSDVEDSVLSKYIGKYLNVFDKK